MIKFKLRVANTNACLALCVRVSIGAELLLLSVSVIV